MAVLVTSDARALKEQAYAQLDAPAPRAISCIPLTSYISRVPVLHTPTRTHTHTQACTCTWSSSYSSIHPPTRTSTHPHIAARSPMRCFRLQCVCSLHVCEGS